MMQLIESFIRSNSKPFNFTDEKAFKVMTESEKTDVANRIIEQLYKKNVERYVTLDMRSIESCGGDITQAEVFKTISESIEMLKKLAAAANVKPSDIDELIQAETALTLLITNKEEFIMAFKKKSDVLRILFTSITVALLDAITVMMDTWLVYVQNPDKNYTITMAREQIMASRNAKRGELAFRNIERFNEMARKGELKKLFKSALDSNFALAVVSAVGLSIAAIFIIREMIYFVYYTRAKIADGLNYQAALLELNASTVAFNSAIDPKKRQEIVKKQADLIKTLKSLSNTIEVKERQGTAATVNEIKKDKEEHNAVNNVANILI